MKMWEAFDKNNKEMGKNSTTDIVCYKCQSLFQKHP